MRPYTKAHVEQLQTRIKELESLLENTTHSRSEAPNRVSEEIYPAHDKVMSSSSPSSPLATSGQLAVGSDGELRWYGMTNVSHLPSPSAEHSPNGRDHFSTQSWALLPVEDVRASTITTAANCSFLPVVMPTELHSRLINLAFIWFFESHRVQLSFSFL